MDWSHNEFSTKQLGRIPFINIRRMEFVNNCAMSLLGSCSNIYSKFHLHNKHTIIMAFREYFSKSANVLQEMPIHGIMTQISSESS